MTDSLSTLKLAFEPPWAWSVTVLVAVALAAFVLLSYPRRLSRLRPFWRRLLFGCRMAAVVAIVFSMLRPALHLTETSQKSASLVFLGDASRSMKITDGPGGITRRQALLKTLEECREPLDELKKRVEIEYCDFAETMTPVAEPQNETDGEQTAIGEALDELLRKAQSQSLASVFLLSDGAQRARPPHDADPRSIARRLGEQQVPVYTISFGTTGLTGSALDVAVEDLQVDPVVFENKAVPVTARVRILGAAQRKVSVRLLVEDRSGRNLGETGEFVVAKPTGHGLPSTQITASQNSEVIPVELSFVPERPGEIKIAVEATPLDDELRKNNNRAETLLTVRKGGIKVAYFDKIRPETKAVRLLTRSPEIQLDTFWVRSGAFKGLNRIGAELFERGKYDVYLIGDVPADVFGPQLLQLLAARVDEGAGLLMMGGFQSFGPGGYAKTPLADALPVRMSRSETQQGETVDTTMHRTEPLQMRPTASHLRHYVMRLAIGEDNAERWNQLPPLRGSNRLKPKSGLVEVLAEATDGTPLLLAQEYGKARVLAFAADTTHLWLQHGFTEETLRFWQQLVNWLARKELESEDAVWVRIEPRNYLPGSSVTIRFGANDASGVPVSDADYSVQVLAPNNEKHDLTPQREPDGGSATMNATELPGDYWAIVSATQQGKALGLNGTARFLIDARDLELHNPAADPDLLNEIAMLTGGSSVPAEQLPALLKRLLDEGIPNLTETRITVITLWDNWYLLSLFVAFLSAEWFLRKSRGLV